MSRPAQTTPDQYFEAGLRILAHQGVAGLKIRPLCRALRVTSGSFYHHFGSWAGFVSALLTYWEAEQTRRLLRLSRSRPDPWERVDVMKHLATTVPHEAEAAIRAWGRGDEQVREVQRQVDAQRHDGLREVLLGVDVPPADAERLATMGMALLTGLQLRSPVDVGEMLDVLDEFEHVVARHTRSASAPPAGAATPRPLP